MPLHLIPTQLKEIGVAGAGAPAAPGAATSTAAGSSASASVEVAAAPSASATPAASASASSSAATSTPAPAAAAASGSDSAMDTSTSTAVSFATSTSVVTIPSAAASAAAAGGDDEMASRGSGKNQAPDSGGGKGNGSGKSKAGAGGKGGKGKGKGGKGKNIEDFTGRKRKRSTGRNIHDGDKKIHVIKNINTIVLGKYEMDVWYYAPFPAEYKDFDQLYFCEFCLKFYGWDAELERHMAKCRLRHPPGNEIYRSEEKNVTIAVFEVDGRKEVIYCQNLCYIAKLFLDDKLYDPEDETYPFDTEPFLFYVLTEVDHRGCHLVGYFSKAKISEKNFNLACILTLPCHQRKGYGKFLISLSYELSKIEEKSGSPEKPLSDLGLVSYRSYWSAVLIDVLKNFKGEISIEELSVKTSITTDDIVDTLKWLKVMRVDANSAEHVYNLKSEAALKVAAGVDVTKPTKSKSSAASTAVVPAGSASGSGSGSGSGGGADLRIEVRPCIAEKLRWTPFIIDPKKAKTSHS